MTDIPLFDEPTPAADLQNVLNILINEINGQVRTLAASEGSVFSSRLIASLSEIPSTVFAIQTAGYATRGDGGDAIYYRTTGSTLGGFQSFDGAWWALVSTPDFNVMRYGATNAGVLDSTTAIQTAIDACALARGGYVIFPAGRYKISATLNVNYPGVQLVGAGRDTRHSVTPPWEHQDNTATITSLEWFGTAGGTMISVTAVAGATSSIGGNGVRQMNLLGSIFPHVSNVAAVGLFIEAGMAGWYDVFTQEFSEAGVKITYKAGMGAGDGSAIYNRFTYIGSRQYTTDGAALKMAGSGGVGDGYNNIFDLIEAGHFNGTAIDLAIEDSCYFNFVRIERAAGGTGKGIVCHAMPTSQIPASSNWFGWLYAGGGGIYFNGTEENTFPSIDNYIERYNTDENSVPVAPIVGTGAQVDWHPQRASHHSSRQPYAYPIGFTPTVALAGSVALAAVAAGNGGAIAIPISVATLLRLDRVAIWGTDTVATLRTAEFGLYVDQGDTTSNLFVRVRSGTFSFTPAGAAAARFAASDSVQPLGPGIYWLVIRNTSAAVTFGIGSATAGTFLRSANRVNAAIATLGATIDISAWSGDTASYAVRLDGRIGAETAAFG